MRKASREALLTKTIGFKPKINPQILKTLAAHYHSNVSICDRGVFNIKTWEADKRDVVLWAGNQYQIFGKTKSELQRRIDNILKSGQEKTVLLIEKELQHFNENFCAFWRLCHLSTHRYGA
ncbi:hypothetical protein ROZALSC1DRAFT_22299 [Rozella allomycis CSF55]|uniref:Uncharacterized protein n=1 Tax=Rozella allomycis (strain CSF55) TaxID=988480 RepID=A0A4P9YLN9_ROZAC|nr:hypothetical protein ROZALSC1DRAFT_22299 [Rozella allomycis CSF55]